MNNDVFIAKIYWLTLNQGGRIQGIPMNNEKYCPIVAVDGKQVFSGSSYGLLCYSYKKIGDNMSLAQIRFLNTKDAPDVLYVGAKLELFEGGKKVANGEVISNSNFRFNF